MWPIPLSTRHVEERMEERGVERDHATMNWWVITYSPQLEEAFHRRTRQVWISWRMDETSSKVKDDLVYANRQDAYGVSDPRRFRRRAPVRWGR